MSGAFRGAGERLSALAVVVFGCSDPSVEGPGQLAEELIHGVDDRVEPYSVDERLRDLAIESTLALIPDTSLQRTDAGIEIRAQTLEDSAHLCPSEAFVAQPAAAVCSGVLVDDAFVLTAGHCAEFCEGSVWVSHYALTSEGALRALGDDDVYRCRSIAVRADYATPEGLRWDYALIELDRRVEAPRRAAPLALRALEEREHVTVIGYPSGLPLKLDTGGSVLETRESHRDFFILRSDTFVGSSGSGVFDRDGALVGVFVRGGIDYEYQPQNGCFAARHVDPAAPASAERASYLDRAALCLCASSGERETSCPSWAKGVSLPGEKACTSRPVSTTTEPAQPGGCTIAPSHSSRREYSVFAISAFMAGLSITLRRRREHTKSARVSELRTYAEKRTARTRASYRVARDRRV